MLTIGMHPITSLEQTKQLASQLSKILSINDVILLQGPLGSGKTEFTRFLIRNLCGETTEVLSPTFMLVQQYQSPHFSLWHYDLYRLKDLEEVFDLGIEDGFSQGVTIIEWPERLAHWRPREYLNLEFSLNQENHERSIQITSTEQWKHRLDFSHA